MAGISTETGRKEAGAHLKKLRKEAGLTQMQLSKAIDLGYYTLISQFEIGSTRIPSSFYVPMAHALGTDRKGFIMFMMRCNEPELFDALFGPDGILE